MRGSTVIKRRSGRYIPEGLFKAKIDRALFQAAVDVFLVKVASDVSKLRMARHQLLCQRKYLISTLLTKKKNREVEMLLIKISISTAIGTWYISDHEVFVAVDHSWFFIYFIAITF